MSNFQMMQRIAFLLSVESQMYTLTIRMHFDQFIDVQKDKFHFYTTHPIFSIASPCTLSNEKYQVNSIFQIYWYLIVDQIHTYQILQTDLV